MKNILTIITLLPTLLCAQEWKAGDWPVLRHYDQQHLYQIALPLGGIGTGTVSLGGRGELRDWEIMNVPGKKYSTVTTGNNAPFLPFIRNPKKEKHRQPCWQEHCMTRNICTTREDP